MKIYLALEYYLLEGEEAEIADVVFHGYYKREDAEMVHPHAEIMELDIDEEPNPQAN